jgi:hypothetical protein
LLRPGSKVQSIHLPFFGGYLLSRYKDHKNGEEQVNDSEDTRDPQHFTG